MGSPYNNFQLLMNVLFLKISSRIQTLSAYLSKDPVTPQINPTPCNFLIL